MNKPQNRRRFLQGATAAAAAPFILPSRIWAADTKPNDRITMAFVGMGKQNRGLLGNFLGQEGVQVVAVCEVDKTRRETAQKRVLDYYKKSPKRGGECDAYVDYREVMARKDIDAVCIATPDHWHAVITLAALNSGKDVYCEKPLTHNIHEAVEVIKAVEKNKRVLQTGSMQRSSREFRIACELVRNGHIGKIEKVHCNFGNPGIPCDLKEEKMEPGLDWNMWLGPAQVRPYNSVLSPRGNHNHFPNWRNYREFGGGMVTDWGAHHLDIAQWGLGMDGSGPVEALPPEKKGDKRGAKLIYGNGVPVIHGGKIGVHFYGSEGQVQVDRGKFSFEPGGKPFARALRNPGDLALPRALNKCEKEILGEAKVKLYQSRSHTEDFLDCVKARKKPITNEIVGGGTAICCHLMNQAYYHGEKLKWDPAKHTFVGGTGKPEWLTRDYRGPFKVA